MDKEAKKLYMKTYWLKNANKLKKNHQLWLKRNPEYHKLWHRKRPGLTTWQKKHRKEVNEYLQKWRKENKERYQKTNKLCWKRNSKKYLCLRKNNIKVNARNILNNAIKKGLVKRLPCIKCGNIKSQGHHEDYSKPLDVVWFCSLHHIHYHMSNILN